MDNTFQTFTADSLDSAGRPVVGNDHIISVLHYDTRAESWLRDYSAVANPFVNGDFSATTITGTAPADAPGAGWYETGSDALLGPGSRHQVLYRIPFFYEEDLLAEYGTLLTQSTTAAYDPKQVIGDYYVNGITYSSPPRNVLPTKYGSEFSSYKAWATSSGVPGGPPGYITWQLDAPREVGGFSIQSYNPEEIGTTAVALARTIGEYQIQVAVSGTGLSDDDYVTVASGTRPYGAIDHDWVEITPTEAKYIRVVFHNSGDPDQTILFKVFAYSPETIARGMAAAFQFSGIAGTATFELNQTVNLAGIDRVYFDVRDFSYDFSSATDAIVKALINGSTVSSFSYYTGPWTSVTNLRSHTLRRGVALNTTAYGAGALFKMKKLMKEVTGGQHNQCLVTNFTAIPSWYVEAASTSRGDTAGFPDEVIVAVDAAGLSLIDAGRDPTGSVIDPRLWMRFDLGTRKMLQYLPRKVAAREGRLYLATGHGLQIISFPDNCAYHLDEWGVRVRSGIDVRNVNSLQLEELSETPPRTHYGYCKYAAAPVAPVLDIYDVAVGTDATFGDFVALGTAEGLVIFNDTFGGSGFFRQSADRRPVYNLVVHGSTVWYVQGTDRNASVSCILDINSVSGNDFVPDTTYHQHFVLWDNLSGPLDPDSWFTFQEDHDMELLEGDVLTISGAHHCGGATGFFSREEIGDRSFTAKVRVRILDFPPDARGGLRFGFANDYLDHGVKTLNSVEGESQRKGFFLSALNYDPYEGHIIEDAPFVSSDLEDQPRWLACAPQPPAGFDAKFVFPTTAGVIVDSRELRNNLDVGMFVRLASVWPMYRRDFTARAQVQAWSGFIPSDATTALNAVLSFGLSTHHRFQPGSPFGGTANFVNPAMQLGGNTTFSGSAVYTTGRVAATAERIFDPIPSLIHGEVLPIGEGDNSGIDTTPFREWRIDYDAAQDAATAYLDGQYIRTQAGTNYEQPPLAGLTFSSSARIRTGGPQIPRTSTLKNLTVTYPPLVSGSRYKYAVEVSDSYGGITNVLCHYTTYSGVSLTEDILPASGTLVAAPALSNGVLHGTGVGMGSTTSVGVGLDAPRTVEALYLYDSVESTSGWSSTATSKRVEVWASDDNISWEFHREYDLVHAERQGGLVKINFSPAVEARFFKVHSAEASSTNFAVGGGSPWVISEVRAITVSGVDFFPTDATADADFHEWKLVYDAGTRQIDGYIDDVLISTGTLSTSMEKGRFVLAHDLTPVSSGTSTTFHAEFCDFSVEVAGDIFISPGDITGFSVNKNDIEGGGPNYTVFTATSSGLGVADLEGVSLPDVFRSFSSAAYLFGDSIQPAFVFADEVAHRDQGLVFVGTGSYTPAKTVSVSGRPFRVDRWEDVGSGDSNFRYGSESALVYHPGERKLFFLPARNAGFLFSVDLETGTWGTLSKQNMYDALELDGLPYCSADTARMAYNPYDDKLWLTFPREAKGFVGIDVRDATVVAPQMFAQNNGYAHTFIVYVGHKHWILFGFNNVEVYRSSTSARAAHPRNLSSGYPNYTRYYWARQAAVPWSGPGVARAAAAVYCDYDRSVYLLGAAGDRQTKYFCRYDPDKDYLETLVSSTDGERLRWPPSDASLEGIVPFNLPSPNTCHLVYDPYRVRIYAISVRGTVAQFHYYDVLEQRWVYEGHVLPYVARRWWYSGTEDSSGLDANFCAYNPYNKSIYVCSHGYDRTLYEYRPGWDSYDRGFEYIPARDGLPTASGVAKHFTSSTPPVQEFSTEAEFNRDFYRVDTAYTSRDSVTTVASNLVTMSGSSAGAVVPSYDLWVSSLPLGPVGDYEVSADVCFPQFSLSPRGYNAASYGLASFALGFADGLNRYGTQQEWGSSDSWLYQVAEVRAGVSGTYGDPSTEYPFMGHIEYSDGQNHNPYDGLGTHFVLASYTNHHAGLSLGSPSSEYKQFKLCYEYETDTVTGYIDGVFAGSTQLRRKFSAGGVRVHFGMYYNVFQDTAIDRYAVRIKNLAIRQPVSDEIVAGRLVSTVSGSHTEHYHERWDSTLMSGISWVYDTDICLPTHRRYSGYDYIATLAGIGDGHKLVELVAYSGPGQQKRVGITGNLNTRHDQDTYLAWAENLWDDVDSGLYQIVRNTVTDTVEVFINGEETPSISVPYPSLPEYKKQHVYYGKVNYGDFEHVYNSPTTSGVWASAPDFTGTYDPTIGKTAFANSALFAALAQEELASATYELDAGLGDVDLYAFYVATGYDGVKNAPYTVYSSGVLGAPAAVGYGEVIYSLETEIDEFGDYDSAATTIRVDQRRKNDGVGTSTNENYIEGSGWVYLGRFRDPTKVVLTTDAAVGTPSDKGFVCANAIGVDIGRHGKSTCSFSVGHVRYQTGITKITESPNEPSGVTVVDLSTNVVIDSYGEHTVPAFLDGNMTAGVPIE